MVNFREVNEDDILKEWLEYRDFMAHTVFIKKSLS